MKRGSTRGKRTDENAALVAIVRAATQRVQTSLMTRRSTGYRIFPGFMIPFGSMACLIARIRAISSGLRE